VKENKVDHHYYALEEEYKNETGSDPILPSSFEFRPLYATDFVEWLKKNLILARSK
jgi:hypothetical protein